MQTNNYKMKNLTLTISALPVTAGANLINSQSDLNTRSQTVVKPVYFIELANVNGQVIEVDYTLNDEWYFTTITMPALISFIESTGMNEYCFDSSDYTGEHLQEAGTFNIDTFINENLNEAVQAYFLAKRIGQYQIN
jgi:hypothetical protein